MGDFPVYCFSGLPLVPDRFSCFKRPDPENLWHPSKQSSFPLPPTKPHGTLFSTSQKRPLAYIFLQKLPSVYLKSGNIGVFQKHVPEFAILCNLL
jgi:hypothetical protein